MGTVVYKSLAVMVRLSQNGVAMAPVTVNSGPGGIAVDSTGNVYATDYSNERVQKFDSTGKFIASWGTIGSGNARFFGPVGVAVDPSGNVYVSECCSVRVTSY